jgi:hypothetical protein
VRAGLVALSLAVVPAARAGEWTRVTPEVIRFRGSIEPGEYDRFAAVFDPSVRRLFVDSRGGVTGEGIRIGLALAAAPVTVVVTGECLSSCANYLFVAGQRREIRNGVVGFHGNVRACFMGAREAEWAAEFRRRFKASDADVLRSRISRALEAADESRLLGLRGVSQELFERSCRPDKGRKDGRAYAYLLPKPETFERYGLRGVVGEQAPAVMATRPYPFAHD